jgi:hypothetical protein
MKQIKNSKLGLFIAIVIGLFFATGCNKSNPPANNAALSSPTKPAGIVFTYWDANNHRIRFLPKDSIKQNIKTFFKDLNTYNLSIKSTSKQFSDSQVTYYTSEAFINNYSPTIAVFNYGPVDAHTLQHIRAYRLSQGALPPPVFGSTVIPPTAANAVDYPGLRTFTSTTLSRKDVRRIGGVVGTVVTPANQFEFATRLDQITGYDYTIDGSLVKDAAPVVTWFNVSAGSVAPNSNGVTPPPPPPTDPAFGYFIDPRTGDLKYYNYWRLDDGVAGAAGHETRVTIMLEEP